MLVPTAQGLSLSRSGALWSGYLLGVLLLVCSCTAPHVSRPPSSSSISHSGGLGLSVPLQWTPVRLPGYASDSPMLAAFTNERHAAQCFARHPPLCRLPVSHLRSDGALIIVDDAQVERSQINGNVADLPADRQRGPCSAAKCPPGASDYLDVEVETHAPPPLSHAASALAVTAIFGPQSEAQRRLFIRMLANISH